MDGQLKRGLLDVCVLAAIKRGDSYGYQILKDMKPRIELGVDSVYHPEAPGGSRYADGPHRGARRPASEVLPHHRSGIAAH